MSKKLLTNLGLVLFGIFFAFGFLEIALRILYPITPSEKVYMPDPILDHRLIPNTEAWFSSFGEFRIHFRVNSHGLVGDEIDYEKPDGTYRILILGDSFMQARQVEEDESTASQLEAYLNAQEGLPPVEVINAGTDDYGTANEVLLLEHEGLRYDPDLVILTFLITNDVANNLSYEGVDWLQEDTITASDLARAISQEDQAEPDEEQDGGILDSLIGLVTQVEQHSLVVYHGFSWISHVPIFYTLFGQVAASSSVDLTHQSYSPQPIPEIETAWETTDRILQRYDRIGSEHDVPVMVVIWPDAGEYNRDWWERRTTAFPGMQGYEPTLAEERLTGVLEERSIRYMTLLPTLQTAEEEMGGDALNFSRDGHPTAAAHHLAAEAIGKYLVAEEVILSE